MRISDPQSTDDRPQLQSFGFQAGNYLAMITKGNNHRTWGFASLILFSKPTSSPIFDHKKTFEKQAFKGFWMRLNSDFRLRENSVSGVFWKRTEGPEPSNRG